MTYPQHSSQSWQRLPWLGAVAALHLALIYALMNGFDTGTVLRTPPPMLAHILQPYVAPPPPPPALPTPDMTAAPDLVMPRVAPPTIELPANPAPTAPAPAPSAATTAAPTTAAPGNGTARAPSVSPLHLIGGAPGPDYPSAYADTNKPGRVTIDCIIQPTGTPTDCRIVAAAGGPAFANETLRWLNGPHHPTYQPTLRDGTPQATEHRWDITFQPQD